jgi:peptidoglycan-associated lipoprotein
MSMRWILGLAAIAGAVATGCGPTYPNCDDDENCHEGEFCVNGRCQLCRTDADCPTGSACVGGRCEPVDGYCQSTTDCPDGQECEENRCRAVTQTTTELPPGPPPSGPVCTPAPVYFGFDEDALDTSARSTIQGNLDCLRRLGSSGAHLTGYTDPRGTEEYNLALGDRRAQAVRQYLQGLGLDPSSITSSSMGEEMATGGDEQGWTLDRRVEMGPR